MKKSMHLIVRGTLAAAAFALASGSVLAAESKLTVEDFFGVPLFTASGGAFGSGNAITPSVWQVSYESNSFLAFCLDPYVPLNSGANSYSSGTFAASDSIKRLYEGYYSSSVANASSNANGAAAFQLALWELNNDNTNLLTGDLRFKSLSNAVVSEANTMLGVATGNGAIQNLYNYTSLTSVNPASQTMLSVSPVPEAQTWAMLAAGLGLLGFMARRRKGASALN
ncbi:PEP-CTERM motif protein [compost metagenome]